MVFDDGTVSLTKSLKIRIDSHNENKTDFSPEKKIIDFNNMKIIIELNLHDFEFHFISFIFKMSLKGE